MDSDSKQEPQITLKEAYTAVRALQAKLENELFAIKDSIVATDNTSPMWEFVNHATEYHLLVTQINTVLEDCCEMVANSDLSSNADDDSKDKRSHKKDRKKKDKHRKSEHKSSKRTESQLAIPIPDTQGSLSPSTGPSPLATPTSTDSKKSKKSKSSSHSEEETDEEERILKEEQERERKRQEEEEKKRQQRKQQEEKEEERRRQSEKDQIKGLDKTTIEETFNTVDKKAFANRRIRLPADKTKKGVSLMAFLKDSVGKDISKITLPAVLCEPLTFLQKCAENFEYSELLDQALATTDPLTRLMYVGVFAVAAYGNTLHRYQKPFNPMLGETYEYVHPEKGWRLICEQVSHHPPVSAAYAEAPEWVFWTEIFVKNKFWGQSLEVFPTGQLNLFFHRTGDFYTWDKVTTCVHNVLIGQMWLEHYGTCIVKNHKTGDVCSIELIKKGWWNEGEFQVKGTVADAKGTIAYNVDGKWSESIFVEDLRTKKKKFEVYRRNPTPAWSKDQYDFPTFCMQLNELPDYLIPYLPATDTRYRPDQRCLENGEVDKSSEEKSRIEEKQRQARKELEDSGQMYKPRWFKRNESNTAWIYAGGYWDARQAKNFQNIPNIY